MMSTVCDAYSNLVCSSEEELENINGMPRPTFGSKSAKKAVLAFNENVAASSGVIFEGMREINAAGKT